MTAPLLPPQPQPLPLPRPLPIDAYEPAVEDAGLGALRTDRGNLPLETLDVDAAIAGLTARVHLSQGFRNPHDVPLEATYVFPLPDRAAVTAMRMEADGRVVEGVLKERGQARADYQRAISEGRRASIAEEERPDVFTMRVGNILPGERVTVRLTLAQPLPYADGEATFRFPLVVAPRYVPGQALGGEQVGGGWAADTDAVPDASRITPPVLLPGFPNPVALSIGVDVDPGGLPLSGMRSSLHAVRTEGTHLSIRPGERADRDFVLRLGYGEPRANAEALLLTADAAGPSDNGGERPERGHEGTFQLTVLPPTTAVPPRPRDVVLVLDRSGSMGGWKMVAARRAAARIVDTLTDGDRFAVLTFDNTVERPPGLPSGLVPGTDRNRYRAVEHLARVDARGGTELLAPLTEAVGLLTSDDPADDPANVPANLPASGTAGRERDRVLVLVTDGQVGNEDQILATLSGSLAAIRVHTVGIDRAVNAGFLTRLAAVGGGRCELVESEDRLDEAAGQIHRRICAPLASDLRLSTDGLELVAGTVAPARLPDLFPGVPLVITGRWRGPAGGTLALSGRLPDGSPWRTTVPAVTAGAPALAPIWARAHLRDLEDGYLAADRATTGGLERRIVETSLRFGVLCRFTAYVAVDSRVVTEGGEPHRVTQPVEPASGWDMLAGGSPPVRLAGHVRAFATSAPDVLLHTEGASGGPAAADAAGLGARAPGGATSGGAPVPGSALGLGRPAPKVGRDRADLSRGRVGDGQFGATPMPPLIPEPLPPAGDVPLWARLHAADEARRLRATATQPPAERHALLADLAGRLAATVQALDGLGVSPALTAPLRQLTESLRSVPPAGLDALWRHALTVLEAFAGGHPAPPGPLPYPPPYPSPPVQSPPSPPRRRGSFWKR